ncbi:hypothetical protein [Microbacterium sp.]|jgi:hypothetical protein|uniref:hypothetical protein n=1 Tax=Microbacterium sp. TaxID=51671 RepID=UPI002625D7AD|nr:hypothetical protein [Microbacterium sp.]
MRRGVELLCVDRIKREAKVFTRGNERQSCKLADRHTLKDLVVDRELASALDVCGSRAAGGAMTSSSRRRWLSSNQKSVTTRAAQESGSAVAK